MLSLFEIAASLLVLSALLSWINRAYLKLPHTIGLLVMALFASFVLMALQIFVPSVGLTDTIQSAIKQIDFNETLMKGMLGFLLFAGALHVDLGKLRDAKWAIGTMATFGVILSTFIVGTGFFYLTKLFGADLPYIWALVFGALISPTDPVAVLSILKTVKMPKSLETKIAGESLFNDGVGVVVFTLILAIAAGGSGTGHAMLDTVLLAVPLEAVVQSGAGHGGGVSVLDVVELFLVDAVGGAILGLIAGWIGFKMMARIDEHAIEILISLALVAGTYALAQRINILGHHLSGPIAVVVAGLMIGNKGAAFAMSDHTRQYLFGFWEMVDEILNSVLFLLIGLEILVLGLVPEYALVTLLAIPLVLIARLCAVYIPMKVIGTFKNFTKGAIPVLTWGGVRGGISVALALSLPENEYKPLILTATYGVVVFSIIVQGLTVKNVVQRVVDPNLL
ncbi:cation:proton antiporter [Litorimonas sp. RW-G-Af-16]|uniref:cation:proton antiporter n=1 Tax=Litorimonas sp. RW-G-Af-16 TaxID=3241168 RepID=UPI00390CAE15